MNPDPGARPRWIIALLLVIASHLLFALGVRHWPQPVPVTEQPAALLIELAPQPQVTPAPKPAVQPPAAKPVAQPPAKAKPLASTAKPQTKPLNKPHIAPAEPVAKVPPEPVSPSQTVVAAAAAPAQSSSKTAEANWQNRLLNHLARYKRYPDDARRRGAHGLNSLRLVIDGTGQVESFALVKLSGSPSLDRATLQMIRRAQPLPAPPQELLEDGRVEVIAPVSYTLDKR